MRRGAKRNWMPLSVGVEGSFAHVLNPAIVLTLRREFYKRADEIKPGRRFAGSRTPRRAVGEVMR